MSNSPTGKAVLVLMLIGALGVGALAWYVKAEPGAARVRQPAEASVSERSFAHRHHSAAPKADDDQEPTQGQSEHEAVFVPTINGPDVTLSKTKREVPDGQQPKEFLVQEVLKADGIDGVKLLGVTMRGNTAVLNFSGDFNMGSMQEGAFLKALQNAFGQYQDVEYIEIDQDGHPLDSLEHIDLTDPVTVIRPGSKGLPDTTNAAP